ncbi:MAG: hypothetical protein ABJG88_03085 [Litorimonas sp.]
MVLNVVTIRRCIALSLFLNLGLNTAQAANIDRPFFRAGPVVIVFSGGDFVENNGEAPLAHDFVLLENVASGTAGNDIIAGDGVTVNFPFDPISDGTTAGIPFDITGQTSGGAFTSNPSFQVLDANDSYTAFGLDNNTNIDLVDGQDRFAFFFVASNAPFDIFATAGNFSASGDFVGLGLDNVQYNFFEITPASASIGQAAQSPSVGGSGVVIGRAGGPFASLGDLASGTVKVFDGGRRTARVAGNIAGQAAGFASLYRLQGSPVAGDNYDLSQGVGSLSADVTYTIFAP